MQSFTNFFEDLNICPNIARMWRARHGLPVIQIGRRLYIDDADFKSWLAQHKSNQICVSAKCVPDKIEKSQRATVMSSKMQRIY